MFYENYSQTQSKQIHLLSRSATCFDKIWLPSDWLQEWESNISRKVCLTVIYLWILKNTCGLTSKRHCPSMYRSTSQIKLKLLISTWTKLPIHHSVREKKSAFKRGTTIKRYPQAAFKAVFTISVFKTFNLLLLYFFTPVFKAYTFAILLFLFPTIAMFVIYIFV